MDCSGHLLDSFARAALWDSGLDYLHGTGHGVGCFLNVHEGPCGISYKTFADEPLEAGMIVSDGTKTHILLLISSLPLIHFFCNAIFRCHYFNYLICFVSEPGYYEDGSFGIRLENVVLVVPATTKVTTASNDTKLIIY